MIKLGQNFLLLGPELGEKENFIARLKDQVRKAHPAVEEYRYYPFEASMRDVVSLIRNGSLFSDAKWVEIPQAETLKKEEAVVLGDYLKDPSADCVMIFSSDGLAKDIPRAVTSAIPQDRTKIFWELFENQKHDWVRDFFKRENLEIEAGVVELILELVENNTRELKKECQRLVLALGVKGRITREDVEQYIYHSREENVFTLFDRFAARQLAPVLESFRQLRLSGEAQPAQVLSGLVWQIRRLLDLQVLSEGRTPFEEACRSLGITGKRSQKVYQLAMKNYPRREVEAIIAWAAETDGLLRKSRPEAHGYLMDLFFYKSQGGGGPARLMAGRTAPGA